MEIIKSVKFYYEKEVKNVRIDRIKLGVAMLEKDISQTALARLAGLSRITVNNIYSGRSCRPETAQKIADALGVDLKAIER